MARVRLCLEISVLLNILLAGLLLSAALNDFRFLVTCGVSGLLGWLVADRWKQFYLSNWMANVLSIVVLYFTMHDFFAGDSSYQLMSVATLLVYLQSVLMFQQKRPRQYWQLLVLNFLQIVIAAVFSLRFEGGVLFLAYMMASATTLWLLTTYDQMYRAAKPAEFNRPSAGLWPMRQQDKRSAPVIAPVLSADEPKVSWRTAARAARHLCSWIVVAFSFSVVMFVLLPRSERAWFGPVFRAVAATGSSRTIKVNPGSEIYVTTELVLRMSLRESVSDQPLRFDQPPYLRGMALGSWAVRDGHTTWEAPYDRIHMEMYEALPTSPPRRDLARIDIMLDATNDPLLYVMHPAVLPWGADESMEFCHELSAVTRRRGSDQIEMNLYRYAFMTPFSRVPGSDGFIHLDDFYAYQPQARGPSARTMMGNPGEFKWLTHFEPSRFPNLVGIADEQARISGSTNHLTIARQLERYLSQSSQFSYTLDFRDVQWDSDLDVVEDFVTNVRRGHCELYASALVLMLRSQGIPARYVVGFLGGELNELGEFYAVHRGLAHAWVEVYIRPEDCTAEMQENRAVAERGAWVRLDPTPSDGLANRFYRGSTAFDFARTIWEDYVLGLDAETQGDWSESAGAVLLGLFDLSSWSDSVQGWMTSVQSRPSIQVALIALLAIALIGGLFWSLRRSGPTSGLASPGVSRWRRWISSVLSLVSPDMANWVLNADPGRARVGFYQKLMKLLQSIGLERKTGETVLEFSQRTVRELESRQEPLSVRDDVAWLTDRFHEIRFGERVVSPEAKEQIEKRLDQLEHTIKGRARLSAANETT